MPSYATSTTTYANGNLAWLRTRKGMSTALTVTLDLTTFTAGTHYPNGFLPSGLVLGKITASGKYGIYDNAAVDGRTVAVGFLLNDENIPAGGTSVPVVTALLTEADVIEARLPSGNGLDANAKTDLGSRVTYA